MNDTLCVMDSRNMRVYESTRHRERRKFENQIESRLADLGKLIAALMDSPYFSLLRERDSIREALDELVVKEVVLRWIVRIAKHSDGTVREALWIDVEAALADLEKNAERFVDAECA